MTENFPKPGKRWPFRYGRLLEYHIYKTRKDPLKGILYSKYHIRSTWKEY
jgi:hypothetical protein